MREMGELWHELEEFGRIRLSTMEDGEYHARLGLHNVTRGLQSNFCTDFDLKTPEAALTSLLSMVREAQEKISADH